MAAPTRYWVDGVLSSALPLPDRGLDFGDGVFETLLFSQAQLHYLPLHLARLERGLSALGFPKFHPQVQQQLSTLAQQLADEGTARAAVRVTVSRGGGPRGYQPPKAAQPRLICAVTQLEAQPAQALAPATLGLAEIRWSEQPKLAGIKHLNRLEQVLAAREAARIGSDEVVMLDREGSVISVSAANLFLCIGGVLHTPLLSHCGIHGTRRQCVINDWAPALGLEVRERAVSVDDLLSADELFYTNALVGIRAVGRFQDRLWQQQPVSQALLGVYQETCG